MTFALKTYCLSKDTIFTVSQSMQEAPIALRGLFKQIVDDENLQVRVVPNNGWSSIIYRQENIDRLLRKCRSDKDKNGNIIGKKFHVLYFGDLDLSGRRMDINIRVDLALATSNRH